MRRWLLVAVAAVVTTVECEEIEVSDASGDAPRSPRLEQDNVNINVDEAMLEDLKKGAADGSERVDKESIVTSDSGNIQDLLRDAGFAPAPPWQSGKRAVRKAARCRACEFVVGMLDEKLMNALSDRTKEMPEPDAAIQPIGEEEFHAMLDAVCTDAELYVETLWESGARTSTGKRDLEFLAAGSRIKAGQDMDEKMKGHYVTACNDVARMYKNELTESIRLWSREPDLDHFIKTKEVLFQTDDMALRRGEACEKTLELCAEGSILVKKKSRKSQDEL